MARVVEPFVCAPGGGLAFENPVGGLTTFKAMADRSGGALTAIEGAAAPGEGPPLHVHRDQDELIYTLEGTHKIRLGDELLVAEPGSFIYIPRGTPHTWKNVGESPSRFFAAFNPASQEFERFFARYAELPDEERDMAAFARLASETAAMEVVGPPLG
jgi:quercetin dioxygenase-like cupin family protein